MFGNPMPIVFRGRMAWYSYPSAGIELLRQYSSLHSSPYPRYFEEPQVIIDGEDRHYPTDTKVTIYTSAHVDGIGPVLDFTFRDGSHERCHILPMNSSGVVGPVPDGIIPTPRPQLSLSF